MTDWWPSVCLSLGIAVCATVLATIVGVPLALALARRRFPGKRLIEGLILMPLVLPPTVVGYLLIMTLGARGWIGHFLGGYSIVFRFEGAVMAAAVVALPMLYLPARAAFGSVDRELQDLATLLGATRRELFWYVTLPLARRGLGSGVVLAFARALGEFGATVMVFGLQPKHMTLPVFVYSAYEQGEPSLAVGAVVTLAAISFGLVTLYDKLSHDRD